MATVEDLEKAFAVYFGEMKRCRDKECYWALLHVVVSLPDICAALESDNGWATEKKYVEWCKTYCPAGLPTPEEYREVRDRVLHQGQTRTKAGRFYKFTKPAENGGVAHRIPWGGPDVIVLDVGKLAEEMIASIHAWFVSLQQAGAEARRANVDKNLPSLVTVKEQGLPGATGITTTFSMTHTSTG